MFASWLTARLPAETWRILAIAMRIIYILIGVEGGKRGEGGEGREGGEGG